MLVGTETGGHSHRTYLCRVCGQLGTDQLDGSRQWVQDYLGPVIAVPFDRALDRRELDGTA